MKTPTESTRTIEGIEIMAETVIDLRLYTVAGIPAGMKAGCDTAGEVFFWTENQGSPCLFEHLTPRGRD